MKSILFGAGAFLFVVILGGGVAYYTIGLAPVPVPEGPPPKPADPETMSVVGVELASEQVDGFPKSLGILVGGERFGTTYTGHVKKQIKVVLIPFHTNDVASYSIDPEEGDADELADALLVDGEPRALLLRFSKRLPGKLIANDINNEIATTFTDVDVPRLRPNIDRFIGKFANGCRPGEQVYFVWLPGGRVYIGYETPDNLELIAEDPPFARALWRCYAGRNQPDRADIVRAFARPKH